MNSVSLKKSFKITRARQSDDNYFVKQSKCSPLKKTVSQTCSSNTLANNKSFIYYDES